MKYIIAILVVGLSHRTHTVQDDQLIDEDLITYQYIDQTTEPLPIEDSHLDQPVPTTIPTNPLETFIHLCMTIVNPPQTNDNLKTVEAMISNLIHTAFQLIKINTFDPHAPQDPLRSHITDMHPILKQLLGDLLRQRAHAFTFTTRRNDKAPANNNNNNRPDETTQKVLGNFAMIVQNFFNIVQDPENPDNVAPNVIGMLAGIVTIGTEVITRGLAIDADMPAIDAFVAHLDQSVKDDFYRMISESIEHAHHE